MQQIDSQQPLCQHATEDTQRDHLFSGSKASKAVTSDFSRKRRIVSSVQYSQVFAGKKSIHNRFFVLYRIKSPLKHARIGIITSRKQLPHAVQRNRCKRLVREQFRRHSLSRLGYDLVIIGKRSLARANNAELVYQLNQLFSKASR